MIDTTVLKSMALETGHDKTTAQDKALVKEPVEVTQTREEEEDRPQIGYQGRGEDDIHPGHCQDDKGRGGDDNHQGHCQSDQGQGADNGHQDCRQDEGPGGDADICRVPRRGQSGGYNRNVAK